MNLFAEADMDTKTQNRFEARARIIKAMAHPTRLFIVHRLRDKEYCVQDLTDMIGADMSTVSRHLSVLRNVGIVADERRGTTVYYSLRMPCVLGFLECVESVIRQNVQEQMAVLK